MKSKNILYIRYALKSDINDLKRIWKICFDDKDEYIDFFFRFRFVPDNTVIAEVSGKLVGAAYLLPAVISDGGRKYYPAYYGYAIGVLPEYRGNGICLIMHDFIYRERIKADTIYFLRPANKNLAEYYKKLELKEAFYLKNIEIYPICDVLNGEKAEYSDISANEYERLRNDYFGDGTFVKWDLNAIEYAIAENALCGGVTKKVVYNKNQYSFMAVSDNNKLVIKETTIPEHLLYLLAGDICCTFGTKEILCTIPAGLRDKNIILSGMTYNTDIKNGYFGLALD